MPADLAYRYQSLSEGNPPIPAYSFRQKEWQRRKTASGMKKKSPGLYLIDRSVNSEGIDNQTLHSIK